MNEVWKKAGNYGLNPRPCGDVTRTRTSHDHILQIGFLLKGCLKILFLIEHIYGAAGFPIAYDSGKRLAVSAVEFPVVLANLEAELDVLYGQFERLAAANERLTDMMLVRVADLEEPDSVEVVEGQTKLGDYVRWIKLTRTLQDG